MEASENSQPSLVDPIAFEPGGSVRAVEDRLVIEALTVTDERAARVVRERAAAGQDPVQTVVDAIEVGARVLDREGSEIEVDYVKAQFERQSAELERRLERTLEGGEEQLAAQISESFDAGRSGSVQQQIRELVGKALEEQRLKIARQFSTEDGTNPLNDFKSAVVREVQQADKRQREAAEASRKAQADENVRNRKELEAMRIVLAELREREEGDRRVAEAEEKGSAKGRSFEELVHAAIERIADGRGDVAIHTGDERGAGGTKLGDTVVEVGAADGGAKARIVFEDKRGERLSKNEAWRQLNGAMTERSADFAVLVVAGEDNIPAGREQLIEYEGNKVIVAVDPAEPDGVGLNVAYRYARLRVLLEHDAGLEVDAAGVRSAAEAAGTALKRIQKVRLALSNIDKNSVVAREGLNEIVADVEAELARIEALVDAVADETETGRGTPET